jgi:uncharacterized membrane protein
MAAEQPIPSHAFAAFGLGAAQLAAPKSALPYRAPGFVWAAPMPFVAGSSLWTHDLRQFGPWSGIHGLSLLTLAAVPAAVWHAYPHRAAQHRRMMLARYAPTRVATGLSPCFPAALPGRIMHNVISGAAGRRRPAARRFTARR